MAVSDLLATIVAYAALLRVAREASMTLIYKLPRGALPRGHGYLWQKFCISSKRQHHDVLELHHHPACNNHELMVAC